MRIWFLLYLVCLGQTEESIYELHKDIVELTDKIFDTEVDAMADHTEDWLVLFYAPWDSKSQGLIPAWNELAQEFQDEVNLARVDVKTEHYTTLRFAIKGFPKIIFIKDGQYYSYSGTQDSASLSAFIKAGFQKEDGLPVPTSPTMTAKIIDDCWGLYEDIKLLISRKMVAACVIYGIGILNGMLLSILVFTLFLERWLGLEERFKED